jgi:hypothetical protein
VLLCGYLTRVVRARAFPFIFRVSCLHAASICRVGLAYGVTVWCETLMGYGFHGLLCRFVVSFSGLFATTVKEISLV